MSGWTKKMIEWLDAEVRDDGPVEEEARRCVERLRIEDPELLREFLYEVANEVIFDGVVEIRADRMLRPVEVERSLARRG